MPVQIIKKSEGIARKISENYKVTNFLTKDSSKNVSLAVSEAKNHSETTKNIRSDRVYYVLEGKLVVKKNGKKFVAKQGDTIFIPKNMEYHFEGTFRAVLINSPAFSQQDERISKSQ
ncbi:MAG: cupin domain-containing protein [archaeon]